MDRRTFLAAGLGALLLSGAARAAWPEAAFEAERADDVLAELGGKGAAASDAITITAPDIAENGAVVPVSVSTTLPEVTRVSILSGEADFIRESTVLVKIPFCVENRPKGGYCHRLLDMQVDSSSVWIHRTYGGDDDSQSDAWRAIGQDVNFRQAVDRWGLRCRWGGMQPSPRGGQCLASRPPAGNHARGKRPASPDRSREQGDERLRPHAEFRPGTTVLRASGRTVAFPGRLERRSGRPRPIL